MRSYYTTLFFPLLAFALLILIKEKEKSPIINKKNEIVISETFLDLEEAKNAARVLNKDILVVFETEWCDTCKKFKKDSVFDTEVNDYILCFLDIEKDKEIAKKYNVKSLPYYIIINQDGKIKKYGSGYKSKNIFINWLMK